MTKHELRAWVLSQGAAVAQVEADRLDADRLAISDLGRQLEGEGATADLAADIARLRHEADALDASLAIARDEVARACERLGIVVEGMLAAWESAVAGTALHSAQDLFDELAPDDLRAPLNGASPVMIEADLARSGLPHTLQANVTRQFERCREAMADASVPRELASAEEEHAACRGELAALEARVDAHDVAPDVIAALGRLRDPSWFLEEVVDFYTAAAVAEAALHLPRRVLKDCGLEP